MLLFSPLNLCFEFNGVTPFNGPTSGGILITAWGALVETPSWNECNTPGTSFEASTPSATYYPSLYFVNKISSGTKRQWSTFASECSTSSGYAVFSLPELPFGAYSGVLWYATKKPVGIMPRGMQDYLSLPFSYDAPIILNVQTARPAVGGGLVTIFGNNFRTSSVQLSVAVGSTACVGISVVSPHTTITCTMFPFSDGASSRLNVSVFFDNVVIYAWRGFSYGDVRGVLKPTPLKFQSALSGASIIVPFVSQSLGPRSTSLLSSVHSTMCAFSAWHSDTSLKCKLPSGLVLPTNSSLRVSVSAGASYRIQRTFFTENPGCQFLQVINVDNISSRCTTGSKFVNLIVGGLGSCDFSVKTRIDGSFCDSSFWVSDSTVASKTSPSMKSLAAAVLSISNLITACQTPMFIPLPAMDGNASVICSATTGPFSLFVTGINMGSIQPCMKLRLASSAASTTRWTSESMIIGKMSTRQITSNTLPVVCSIRSSVVNLNVTLNQIVLASNVGIAGLSDLTSNLPSTGNSFSSLVFASAGTMDSSSRISRGFSACQASLWKSESSIICKSGAILSSSSTVTISMILRKSTLNTTVVMSLALPFPNVSEPLGVASSGSGIVAVLQCRNLGILSVSKNIRLQKSACQVSTWISESSIICKPHLLSNLFGGIVISGERSLVSANVSSSWRFLISSNSTNVPFTGSSLLSILGFGFLSHDLSSRARLRGSACEFSLWKSSSSLNAKVPTGKGTFATIVSLQNDRFSDDIHISVFDFEDFSFAPYFYTLNGTNQLPSTGGLVINLFGLSASNEDQSAGVRLR